MKFKTFLKSQTFKCILVLLVIALISGGLLAIANDLLSVSEAERTSRAIKSIYGKEMKYEPKFDSDEDEHTADTQIESVGYIQKVYELEDGNYLIKATGLEGYKSGTITVWAVVSVSDGVKMEKVSIAEYDKQTLMSKFDGKVMEKAVDVVNGNENGGEKVVVSGATYSANAFNNALIVVQKYANTLK